MSCGSTFDALSAATDEYLPGVDFQLRHERARWAHHASQLLHQLLHSRQAQVLAAAVHGHRHCFAKGKRFVEYEVALETNWRGSLRVWHRYSTFRSLAASLKNQRIQLPKLPAVHLFSPTNDRTIETRKAQIGAFLTALVLEDRLQWSLPMGDGTRVGRCRSAEHLPVETLRALVAPSMASGMASALDPLEAQDAAALRRDVATLTRRCHVLEVALGLSGGVTMKTAVVIDAKWVMDASRRVPLFKVHIETVERGIFTAWFRYATFTALATSLKAKYGWLVPELEADHRSDRNLELKMLLVNNFLNHVLAIPAVEWGIRINNTTCAFKRHQKFTLSPSEAAPSIETRVSSTSTAALSDDGVS
ncbi:myosin-like protein [Achlya hypogyna]|uniref:Myosin-like protein n=1 Tax=Achlya hypogyna TaxID=1202772 RepID=A0A1V9ZDT3_ACHHY|nr:myosin-like protein [Achlya hypogyna]